MIVGNKALRGFGPPAVDRRRSGVLMDLLDAVIDRAADHSGNASVRRVDQISHDIFEPRSRRCRFAPAATNEILKAIGKKKKGDLAFPKVAPEKPGVDLGRPAALPRQRKRTACDGPKEPRAQLFAALQRDVTLVVRPCRLSFK